MTPTGEIGEALSTASSTVNDDVKPIREQWWKRATVDYASFLAKELAKLDLVEREVSPKAQSGGPKVLI
jgi:hypothetical protein